jgi:hypothetical protein
MGSINRRVKMGPNAIKKLEGRECREIEIS